MAAAMIGGTAHMAHKAGQRSAEAQQREYDQEARLQELESQQSQQQYAPPPPPPQYAAPPPPPAAPAAGGTDIASQIQQLAQLRDQGVLSPEEFEAAKHKLLGG